MKRHSHTKPFLPSKLCAVCGRPFVWRKKWAKVWDEVRYCSEGCRKRRAQALPSICELVGGKNP